MHDVGANIQAKKSDLVVVIRVSQRLLREWAIGGAIAKIMWYYLLVAH